MVPKPKCVKKNILVRQKKIQNAERTRKKENRRKDKCVGKINKLVASQQDLKPFKDIIEKFHRSGKKIMMMDSTSKTLKRKKEGSKKAEKI